MNIPFSVDPAHTYIYKAKAGHWNVDKIWPGGSKWAWSYPTFEEAIAAYCLRVNRKSK